MRSLWIVAAVVSFSCQGATVADSACPIARPEVQVAAVHGEVHEVWDMTVADLAQSAKERNAQLRHPILGAYTSTIGIGLQIEDKITDLGEGHRCSLPTLIRVHLSLAGRAVHMPRDFADDACLLDLARSHQRKHTQADDALFDGIVSRFADDLRARFMTLFLDPAPSESAARLRMTEAASKIVKEQLDRYEDAKANVDKMVDTPEEVVRISKACGATLKSQGGLRG
jgi:hypothetical protein